MAQAAADKPVDKPKGWESVASLGVTLTSGNSENFLATLGFNTARKWPKDEMMFGANAGYGESRDKNADPETRTTTDQYARGFGQWNHLFSERLYAGLRLDGIYDHVAGIDYRATASPLLGYYFIKKPNTFLAGEVGPSFIAENLSGEEATQYIGLRVGERFEHKFSERAKVWQTAEWIPQVSDFDNWLLTVEIGVSAALSKSLDLRIVLQDQYDNQPALKSDGSEREKNDLKLIAGIGYKF
jgi:putative salt-induced outer membrane protein YdiY